jgi:hypothetical protein
LASLERQRFGVACFFKAMPGHSQYSAGTSTVPSWPAVPAAGKPYATAGRRQRRAGSLIRVVEAVARPSEVDDWRQTTATLKPQPAGQRQSGRWRPSSRLASITSTTTVRRASGPTEL